MKNDKLKKISKYLLQFTIVFVAAKYIPYRELTFKEITIIAIISAIAFATLDIFSSSIAHTGHHQVGDIIGFTTLLA